MTRLRFDAFELDTATRELFHEGKPMRLPPQPVRVLEVLAANAGRLVTREHIHAEVWSSDTFVDFEQGLNFCIRQIRDALGDDAKQPTYIETLPRRGYRFLARVERVEDDTRYVRLAVLPFANMSGDPDQEFLSDGLTDETIGSLGRLNPKQLRVIARTSAMQYKHTTKGVGVIGRELGVAYVLEGSVRRAGDRVRVSVRLVDVVHESPIWTDSYDRAVGDTLALQSDLARAIAEKIRVQLTPEQIARLARPQPIDAGAYEAYLLGRYSWNRRSRDSLKQAVRHFERAIELHPGYAAAYAGLADAYLTQLDFNHLAPLEAFDLAGRAVAESLRLDPSLAAPYTSLGHLRFHEFKWREADDALLRAVQMDPGYGSAHFYRANLLAAFRRFDEAHREARLAVEIDPIAANARQNRVFLLYVDQRYEESLEHAMQALAIDASLPNMQYLTGLILERLGRYEESLAAFARVERGTRGGALRAAIGFTQGRAGNRLAARNMLEELEAMASELYVSSYDLALLHLVLGEHDAAVERLWKALHEHASFIPFVNVDSRLADIRSHRRFGELVAALGLPGTVGL